MTKIDYITDLITNHGYESDAMLIGNVDADLMKQTKAVLSNGISQCVVVIDGLNPHIQEADQCGDAVVIFEYFWGMVYEYLNSERSLRDTYVDDNTIQKLQFFKTILENPLNIDLIKQNKDILFAMAPDRVKFFMNRNYFKIGVLNYQAINSIYLLQTINSVIRSGPPHIPIFILTETEGLKIQETNGGEWICSGHDFHYYNVKTKSRNGYRTG